MVFVRKFRELRTKLQALKRLDNTPINFLSNIGSAHNNTSNTSPLKDWKIKKIEGGHGIPFIVS